MTIARRSGSTWIGPSIKRRSGGSWVTPTAIKRRSAGSWVTIWPQVVLGNEAPQAFGTTDIESTSHYKLTSSGDVAITDSIGIGYTTVGTWLNLGANTDYEARATSVSDPNGTLSGTFGSWVALTSDVIWNNDNLGSGGGTSVASMLIEIREISSGIVLDSATITFSSEWT